MRRDAECLPASLHPVLATHVRGLADGLREGVRMVRAGQTVLRGLADIARTPRLKVRAPDMVRWQP